MVRSIWLVITVCVVGLGIGCTASSQMAGYQETAGQQATFSTPEAAVDAMAQAVASRDRQEMQRIFGPRIKELCTGNRDQDEADMQRLAAALQRGYRFEDAENGDKNVLVGADGWVFPVPLMQQQGRWQFDTDEGVEEVIDRRVGRNELDAIATCGFYVAAQKLYFQMNPDKAPAACYASRLASTTGKRDGLYWFAKDDEPQSPLGPLVEAALERGTLKEPVAGQRQAYRGYFFKVLNGQGPAAAGGEMSYVDANGRMTKGFAMLAWPAEYGRSGVKSFMVAKDGMVYQADLGKDTAKTAGSITTFNPDAKWTRAQEPTTAPSTITKADTP